MLQPKRVRYRRPQDGRGNKGNAHRGTTLAFGSFGIKTLDAKWIDSRQIEAARVAINRYMNREGQVCSSKWKAYLLRSLKRLSALVLRSCLLRPSLL